MNGYNYEKDIINSHTSLVAQAQSSLDHSRVAIETLNNDQIIKINQKKLDKLIQILENFKDEKYFLTFYESIQDLEYGMVGIVTQIYEKNLAQILENNKFTMSQIQALTYQLLKGVLLLEEKGIVIKDIQPSNILYSSSKNQFLLTYHRLSKLIEKPKKEQQKRNLNYTSPNVIDKIKPYTTQDDIYSVGVIILEALLQRKLQGMEYIKLKSSNLFSVFPELKSHESSEFITKILCKMIDPDISKLSQPIVLIQQLNKLKVDEKSLKLLNLETNFQCNQEIKLELMQEEETENYDQIQQQKKLQEEQRLKKQIKLEQQNTLQANNEIVKSNNQTKQVSVGLDQTSKEAAEVQFQQLGGNLKSQVEQYKANMIENRDQQSQFSVQKKQKQFEIIEIIDDKDSNLSEYQISQQTIKLEYDLLEYKKSTIYEQDQQVQAIPQSKLNSQQFLEQNLKYENSQNLTQENISQQQSLKNQNQILFQPPEQTQFYQGTQEKDSQIQQNYFVQPQIQSLFEIQNILNKQTQKTDQNLNQNVQQISHNKNIPQINNQISQNGLNDGLSLESLNLQQKELNKNLSLEDQANQLVSQLNFKPAIIEDQNQDKIDLEKEIKINKVTDIYKSENYEIVDFDFRQDRIHGQGTLFLGMTLQKCQKMTHLSLNFDATNNEISDYQQMFYISQEIQKIGDQDIIQITKSLQKCTNLTSLSINLCKNNISSKGVQFICNYLEQAQNIIFLSLDLSFNDIREGGLYLAQAFCKCQNLVSLDLNFRNTQLLQRDLNNICSAIGKLINLNFLQFDISSNFTKDFINLEELAQIFNKCKDLVTLSLKSDQNLIEINDILQIMMGVENCINLVTFQLSLQSIFQGQQLDGNVQNYVLLVIQCLCIGIQKINSLSSLSLDLSFNTLQIDQIKAIADNLKKCQNITSLSLNLRDNWVDVEGLKYIGISLEYCQKIDKLELNLQNNKLGLQGLEDFTQSLSKCQQFQHLMINFSLNNIGNSGAQLMGQSISKLQNLKYLSLNLDSNQIGSEGTKSIALGLQACVNLRQLVLILSKNNITINTVELLASCLKNCTNIYDLRLDLSRNKLKNKAANSIGVIFSQCLNIKKASLHLEGNSFDKLGIDEISNHLQNCTFLVYLNLSLNFDNQQIQQFRINKLSIDNQITQIEKKDLKLLLLKKCQKLKELTII
ncbi:hypothetical protein ABPG74_019685 [Tetrahymena malaccensis]